MPRNSRTEAIRRKRARSGFEADGTEHLTHLLGAKPAQHPRVMRIVARDLARVSVTPASVFGGAR